MVEYILGNYLVETGKITREQLQQVMSKQDSVRVKLGLIAVEEGLMTMEQADEVNRMQAVMDQKSRSPSWSRSRGVPIWYLYRRWWTKDWSLWRK